MDNFYFGELCKENEAKNRVLCIYVGWGQV